MLAVNQPSWNVQVLDFDGKIKLLPEAGICKYWILAVNITQHESASKGICR